MPILNVSGYRGIWGTDLNEQIAYEFGIAFAQFIKNHGGHKILVGRDARKTGEAIFGALQSAFQNEGLEIEYAGIIPTPSMLFLIRKLGFDGGVMITASHNPPEYNGLKFINSSGLFATQKEIEEITKNKEKLPAQVSPIPGIGENVETDNSKFRKLHIDEILKNIDVDLIKNKKFKVALDPINSAGSIITQELLKELSCEVYAINTEQNGEFAHEPEPLPKNLGQIGKAVLDSKSDVGFAQDPDADRLVIVNEKGEVLNEEYTLALSVKSVLSKNPGDIVINMSTSRINEDIAKQYGGKTYYSKVGEANVVEMIQTTNSIMGGEGGGGVIYPRINTARDSLVGIALTLELMANENKLISEIADSLPKYFMKKDKLTFSGDLNNFYEKLKITFRDATLNTLDGVRFDWADSSWIHIRPSNTEPIVRIIGEAKDENRINSLFDQVRLTLNS
ncbi:MAG: phosphoglucosamine mutase [Minisyncoccia bacterium]